MNDIPIDVTAEELEQSVTDSKYSANNVDTFKKYVPYMPFSLKCSYERLFVANWDNNKGHTLREFELNLPPKSEDFGNIDGATEMEVRFEHWSEPYGYDYQYFWGVHNYGIDDDYDTYYDVDLFFTVATYWVKDNKTVGFCACGQEDLTKQLYNTKFTEQQIQDLAKGQIAQNFNQSEHNPLQFSDKGDGSYEMQLNCDTELSSESENPVQNKVLASILEDKADKEYVGNYAMNYTKYYAEKKMETSTVLNNPLTANCNYFFTVDDNFILSFPTEDLTRGDTVYLNFECSTDVTLIVDTSNTTSIDIIPEANKGYEVFGCWNGNKWILGYDEYDLPETM